jgi:hypothetical protein
MDDLQEYDDELQADLENRYGNDAGWHPCSHCDGGTYVTDHIVSDHAADCVSLIPVCSHTHGNHGKHCPIFDENGMPR